ncbi:MAG TPA: TraB/GumN family protein [Sphingopyxis sp.]|nr:TraB/GumN family protein [Sphingopyxis sp.]
MKARNKIIAAMSAALLSVALLWAALFFDYGSYFGKQQTAHPALWLVTSGETKIYLLGSMHALPRNMLWQDQAITKAMDEAETLVLELSPAESAKAGAIFNELAPRSTPIALEQRLSPSDLAAFHAMPKATRTLFADNLDDWAILLMMGQKAARDARLKAEFGVEAGLTRYFKSHDKKIIGLENARNQLMMFETLDESSQKMLLAQALQKAGSTAKDIDALLSSWARGDLIGLEQRVNEDVENIEPAYKTLILDRNLQWADWVDAQMSRGPTLLIAVGAGHMVGDQGLPSLLQKKGYQVQRLQ